MILEDAISIASQAHAGQVDKAGAPYILHPLRVMMAMSTEDERVVAVMHDVLEDCRGWDEGRLRQEGFTDELVDALWALARHDGETYEDFIRRCATNPLALRVKLADLADNSDLSRLPSPGPRDIARTAKYAKAREFLSAVLASQDTSVKARA